MKAIKNVILFIMIIVASSIASYAAREPHTPVFIRIMAVAPLLVYSAWGMFKFDKWFNSKLK